jgi:hypothetical protein
MLPHAKAKHYEKDLILVKFDFCMKHIKKKKIIEIIMMISHGNCMYMI